MPLETFYKTVNSRGEYSCGEIGISTEEWLDMLKHPNSQNYLDILCCFLREPEHAGTCNSVAEKYGNTYNHYNAKVTNFSKWVQKSLNRFKVLDSDGSETYWCIIMQKGWDTKHGFKWQLRNELVEALQRYLMSDLIAQYSKLEPFNGFDEEYKWALLDRTEDKSVLDIIKNLRGENIVDNARVDGVFSSLWKSNPEELTAIGEHLIDETQNIDKRIAIYKAEMRALCPKEWNNCANDERTAAAILTCKYPLKYTVYKDEIYQLICRYFGFESRKAGKKFSHFIEIINKFTDEFGEEIQEIMLPSISDFRNKPLNLAVQTMFWCMRERMKAELKNTIMNYWLAGYSYGGDRSQFNRFIKDSIWECSYDDNKAADQKQLAETRTISVGDVIILKSSSTKGSHHDQPFLRVKAVGVVTSEIIVTDEGDNKKKCHCSVDYINTDEKDFDGSVYGHYRKTVHRADGKVKEIIDYVNKLLNEDTMPQNKYQKYIELLQETHNLVLTGAPGTGKTYMAQKIAEEMGAVTKFVQFHPSYDYTDFVEGLRPIEKEEGQMGFERRDGIFKEFCREAIKNLTDSKKSIESLSKELSWQEQLEMFIEDAIENKSKFKTVNGSEFIISDLKGHFIVVHNEQNEKTTKVYVNADEILELLKQEVPLNIVRDIRNHFNRKFGTQPDSYAYVITKEVRAMKKKAPVVTANKIDEKPFVLIIDEINRGEASKIFGELFYAIDPGYRDKKDNLVQTQYQNLVPETDVFAKGFYVPRNVFILATMNDIDRSVESMDFAMRRRFTWQEVTPDDTESMLDELSCAIEAKETMHRLNNAIAETDGLGAAYMIGPSYFLKLGENGGNFEKLWKMNIEPLLKEYLRGFRKSSEILEKFNDAFFNEDTETTTGHPALEDED